MKKGIKIAIILLILIIAGIIIRYMTKPSTHKNATVRDENLNLIQSLSDEDWKTPKPDIPDSKIYNVSRKKFIKDIVFERNPVCANEDFEVQVLANNPEGPDSELTYRVNGRFGNPVILRFRKPGEKKIHVFVRDARENVDHRVFTLDVMSCPERPSIYLKTRYSSTRAEEAEFEVTEKKGLRGDCTYEWEFGDGTQAKTDSGFTTHNYGKREQNEFASSFTISVTVTDAEGTQVTARTSISFPNIQWISNRMGRPIFPVIYNRFPDRASGEYEVGIKIKNIYPDPITLSGAEVRFRSCTTATQSLTTKVNPAEYLALTEIKAGEIVDDVLHIPRNKIPKLTCGILITLQGAFPDGRAVTGRINLTIPISNKDARKLKNAKVVTDKNLIEKIRQARKILGRQIVTPSDLRRLEKEGKL